MTIFWSVANNYNQYSSMGICILPHIDCSVFASVSVQPYKHVCMLLSPKPECCIINDQFWGSLSLFDLLITSIKGSSFYVFVYYSNRVKITHHRQMIINIILLMWVISILVIHASVMPWSSKKFGTWFHMGKDSWPNIELTGNSSSCLSYAYDNIAFSR